MRDYVLKRLLLIIPTLFVVTLIIFFTARLVPGDIIDQMIYSRGPDASLGDEKLTREALQHAMGLDLPIYEQYARWLGNAVQGDLGKSLWERYSITEELLNRLPVTVELGLMAIMFGIVIALPTGIYSAVRQDTLGDYIGRGLAILAIAIPSFWLGTIVVVLPSVWWGWSPSMTYIPFFEDPMGNLTQFVIPAIILGMVLSGTTMRMTRTMMLEVLRQDYVRTAWAKGLSERVVIVRHAIRNALMPVVTIIGLQLPIIMGGSVILEQVFNLPGIGRLLIDAINRRDWTVLSGINLLIATFVLIINLAVDLTYSWLDPRIRYR